MILLLGGTTETATVAQALAQAGRRVLVSTATSNPLEIGNHPNIRRREGRLDESAMADLIAKEHIQVLVDVTHPYATEVRSIAERVAAGAGIPYFTYIRPPSLVCGRDGARPSMSPTGVDSSGGPTSVSAAAQRGSLTAHDDRQIIPASNHESAASLACSFRKPILLTIGSRHVAEYVRSAATAGIPVFARVLPHPESITACREAGLTDEQIITGRGPFSAEENLRLIRRLHIGVIVTKDSGDAGGFPAKREAALLEACRLIVVTRAAAPADRSFHRLDDLLQTVLGTPTGEPPS